MRVLHVIYSLRPDMGGLPRAALSLAAAQAAEGAEVAVAAYDVESAGPRFSPAFHDIPGLDRVRWIRIERPGMLEYLTARAMIPRLREFHPHAVHTHGLWEPLLRHAHRMALRQNIPHVPCPHSMLNPWQNRNRRMEKWMLTRVLDWERLWRRAAFVHALSGAEAERLRRRGLERVRVFPNGIFSCPDPPGTPAHPPEILFLGRLDRVKRADLLLEAFILLAARTPDPVLVLAGPDYGTRNELQRRAGEAGLEERVKFPGMLAGDAKRDALRRATCFCLPSQSEGCSLAVLEAAAAGLPLLLSEACDLDDWFDEGTALKVAATAVELAAQLEEILDSKEKRETLGKRAGAKVESDFLWRVTARRLLAAYAEGEEVRTWGIVTDDTNEV